MESTGPKETLATASETPLKQPASSAAQHFLFKCLLNVILEENDVVIEMHWVEVTSSPQSSADSASELMTGVNPIQAALRVLPLGGSVSSVGCYKRG
ncbi:hypothetical protein INR49_031164 [Caranx melampygus]|nr:hypothetical protein INR49_031164 [Caranx melampygus]